MVLLYLTMDRSNTRENENFVTISPWFIEIYSNTTQHKIEMKCGQLLDVFQGEPAPIIDHDEPFGEVGVILVPFLRRPDELRNE